MDKTRVKKPGKPGPRPVPRALQASLSELNDQVRKQAAKRFGQRRRRRDAQTPYFYWRDLVYAYHRFGGRCAFCGLSINAGQTKSSAFQVKFTTIVPLDKGGEVKADNLQPVCWFHYRRYLPRRRPMERIPGVDSLADLIVHLSQSVKKREETKTAGDGDGYLVQSDKIDRLKSEINSLFEEVAVHFQYRVFREDMPKKIEPRVEGKNSLADLIEQEDSEELADGIKQIHYTGQYRTCNREAEE